jgi:hypothetical protein
MQRTVRAQDTLPLAQQLAPALHCPRLMARMDNDTHVNC